MKEANAKRNKKKPRVRSAASKLCLSDILEDIPSTFDETIPESPKNNRDQFTVQEIALFERRYANGFDLTIDGRYIDWLKLHYPEEADRLTLQPCVSSTKTSESVFKGGKY